MQLSSYTDNAPSWAEGSSRGGISGDGGAFGHTHSGMGSHNTSSGSHQLVSALRDLAIERTSAQTQHRAHMTRLARQHEEDEEAELAELGKENANLEDALAAVHSRRQTREARMDEQRRRRQEQQRTRLLTVPGASQQSLGAHRNTNASYPRAEAFSSSSPNSAPAVAASPILTLDALDPYAKRRKDFFATRIQCVWRGYRVRKTLRAGAMGFTMSRGEGGHRSSANHAFQNARPTTAARPARADRPKSAKARMRRLSGRAGAGGPGVLSLTGTSGAGGSGSSGGWGVPSSPPPGAQPSVWFEPLGPKARHGGSSGIGGHREGRRGIDGDDGDVEDETGRRTGAGGGGHGRYYGSADGETKRWAAARAGGGSGSSNGQAVVGLPGPSSINRTSLRGSVEADMASLLSLAGGPPGALNGAASTASSTSPPPSTRPTRPLTAPLRRRTDVAPLRRSTGSLSGALSTPSPPSVAPQSGLPQAQGGLRRAETAHPSRRRRRVGGEDSFGESRGGTSASTLPHPPAVAQALMAQLHASRRGGGGSSGGTGGAGSHSLPVDSAAVEKYCALLELQRLTKRAKVLERRLLANVVDGEWSVGEVTDGDEDEATLEAEFERVSAQCMALEQRLGFVKRQRRVGHNGRPVSALGAERGPATALGNVGHDYRYSHGGEGGSVGSATLPPHVHGGGGMNTGVDIGMRHAGIRTNRGDGDGHNRSMSTPVGTA